MFGSILLCFIQASTPSGHIARNCFITHVVDNFRVNLQNSRDEMFPFNINKFRSDHFQSIFSLCPCRAYSGSNSSGRDNKRNHRKQTGTFPAYLLYRLCEPLPRCFPVSSKPENRKSQAAKKPDFLNHIKERIQEKIPIRMLVKGDNTCLYLG